MCITSLFFTHPFFPSRLACPLATGPRFCSYLCDYTYDFYKLRRVGKLFQQRRRSYFYCVFGVAPEIRRKMHRRVAGHSLGRTGKRPEEKIYGGKGARALQEARQARSWLMAWTSQRSWYAGFGHWDACGRQRSCHWHSVVFCMAVSWDFVFWYIYINCG